MGGILGCLRKLGNRCGCIKNVPAEADDISESDEGGFEMRDLLNLPVSMRSGIGERRGIHFPTDENTTPAINTPCCQWEAARRLHYLHTFYQPFPVPPPPPPPGHLNTMTREVASETITPVQTPTFNVTSHLLQHSSMKK
ncbi:unnamed protein product [Orchesella dallaii]|uniref:Uncharacterized protein n=1 Tax=Orchesella dallaii TaxID=48710 RepID=A0ABP1QTX6_9HEXA